MLRYAFYPLFGLSVLGSYAVMNASGADITSVRTTRSSVPATYGRAEDFQGAPLIWRTGFHGPGLYRTGRYRSTSGYRGGYFGGFGGGK
ncbi:MAG: hypothetical protein AAF355_08340 [Myxococcota bacterium]